MRLLIRRVVADVDLAKEQTVLENIEVYSREGLVPQAIEYNCHLQ